ncbi:MAG: gamma-glutamyl-gamma-aminobutyrate hydrolase family protein [Oscillospiraceae bacterium]|nr:gamma-glutamyl-gamma-aminobutyrate hydrolase family protein [Oscillospiraceae bacterium]
MYGNRPVIGICPLYDEKRESYWMLPGYMNMLEAQGAIPMMLPLTTDTGMLDYFLETCDGFILTGGQDVSPAVYGQEKTDLCGVNIPQRDEMDAYILKEAIAKDKVVLGICRGHQLMNAALGGTLYQDVATQHEAPINHRMQPPYDGVEHKVDLIPGSPMAALLGARMGVNSCHHQAIRDLAPCLKVQAMAADGIAEAVYMPGKRFVWGVQWHPEFAWKVSEDNRKIVAEFLKAAKGEK